ncbi:MAG: hypothetical protein LC132_10995, partial [Burkholderiales bacterium]|nr:hypothetical protein [Burkholderiales bacterium]
NVQDKQTISISALLNPVQAPVTMSASTPPVETPRPLPTRSGIMSSVASVAALIAVLLIARNRYDN